MPHRVEQCFQSCRFIALTVLHDGEKVRMFSRSDNQMTCEQRREQCLELLRDRKQSARCIIDKNAKVMNEIGVESTRK